MYIRTLAYVCINIHMSACLHVNERMNEQPPQHFEYGPG